MTAGQLAYLLLQNFQNGASELFLLKRQIKMILFFLLHFLSFTKNGGII